MTPHKLLVIISALLTMTSIAMGQPTCTVHTFGLKDGLSTNVVSGITTDNNGLIWLTTVNGVSFYDGYAFHALNTLDSRPNVFRANRMLSADFDSDNNLWCRSIDENVYRYSTHNYCYTDILKLIFGDKVPDVDKTKIFVGAKGFMWVSVWLKNKQLVYRLRNDIAGKDGLKLVASARRGKGEVLHILTDAMQNEWLLFYDRVELYNNGKPIYYKYNKVYATPHSTILYNNHTGSVARFSPNGKRAVALASSKRETINSVTELADHSVVLATTRGMERIDANGGYLKPVGGTEEYNISNVEVDSKGRLWGFTADGMVLLCTKSGSTVVPQLQTANFVTTKSEQHIFFEDDNHTIWAATANGSFSYYDEHMGALVPYHIASTDMPFANLGTIKRAFCKGGNCLWLSTGYSLILLTFYQHRYQFTPIEENQEVRALCIDKQGHICAGTDGGIVALTDRVSGRTAYLSPTGQLTDSPVKFSAKIRSIYCDRLGRLWIGTRGEGLYVCSNGLIRHFTATKDGNNASLNCENIYDFLELPDGRMLVATYGGGLNIATEGDDGNFFFANNSNHLLPYPKGTYNRMRRIVRTANGIILLATTEGLVTFDGRPQKIKRFFCTPRILNDTTSLLSSDVMSILPVKGRDVFVATRSGGMQKITARNLLADSLKLGTVNGLNDYEGVMQSIVEDNKGNIWVVREQSIDRISSEGSEAGMYTTNETGQRLTLSETEPVYDPHTGNLYLGALGGLATINLTKLTQKGRKHNIVFTTVLFQGDKEPQMILNADMLEVPVNKRSLTISFSTLNYDNNDNIRYAYKLEGVDQDWNYTTYTNSATYNNLPAGTLTFKVKSTDVNGIWQDNERTLTIHVEPRFTETVWAKIILAIIVVLFIWWVLRYWDNRRQLDLNRRMNAMRTKFYDEVSHQLRTPLALIGSPVTEVLRTANLGETERKMLEMVQRNSRKMLDLVNKLINYDKADNYLVDDNSIPTFSNAGDEETETRRAEDETKILVVEDNDDLRNFLRTILAATYHVTTARNGQEGLDKAESEAPDFIITDVMMPVMDGMTMVHKLKQKPQTSHIPVIILSAKASMSDRLEGLREGVDDYITKPFSANYLKVRVENILSRRRLLQQDVLSSIDNSQSLPAIGMPQIVDTDKKMMDKLMKFIEEHIDDSDLKVEDMAEAMFLGRTVFNEKIKSLVGMTPNKFLTHIRLEKAKYLILNSKYTFSEVAAKVGFADARYFSKCFKREVGCTPSEYREKKNTQQ